MPITSKYDLEKKKPYVQFGKTGAKYYFISGSDRSHKIALAKAQRQASAIHISQNEGQSVEKKKINPKSGSKTNSKT